MAGHLSGTWSEGYLLVGVPNKDSLRDVCCTRKAGNTTQGTEHRDRGKENGVDV